MTRRARIARVAIAVGLSFLVFSASSASAVNHAGSDGDRVRVSRGIYIDDVSPGGLELRRQLRKFESPAEPRIVGGTPVSITQVPWQAAVTLSPTHFPGNGYERQICGGSLVSQTLVVTAFHCLFHPADGRPLAVEELAAITGRTYLSSGEGQESALADAYVFTDAQGNLAFDPHSGAWDVAILELAQASPSPPIKLAGPDESALWSSGRRAYVSGWGSIDEESVYPDDYPDGLLAAELAVFGDHQCSRAYGNHPQIRFDPSTTFCAGTALGERDSCYGDSGGPVVVPTADGAVRLVGVVSMGEGCARAYYPGIYGRVAADPVRTALRNAALEITGTDIVGSGAGPPTALTREQAEELTWMYSEDQCYAWRKCRRYDAGNCAAQGAGFRCVAENLAKSRRRLRFTCRRTTYWTGETGVIQRHSLGKWKCFRGW